MALLCTSSPSLCNIRLCFLIIKPLIKLGVGRSFTQPHRCQLKHLASRCNILYNKVVSLSVIRLIALNSTPTLLIGFDHWWLQRCSLVSFLLVYTYGHVHLSYRLRVEKLISTNPWFDCNDRTERGRSARPVLKAAGTVARTNSAQSSDYKLNFRHKLFNILRLNYTCLNSFKYSLFIPRIFDCFKRFAEISPSIISHRQMFPKHCT